MTPYGPGAPLRQRHALQGGICVECGVVAHRHAPRDSAFVQIDRDGALVRRLEHGQRRHACGGAGRRRRRERGAVALRADDVGIDFRGARIVR